jgi:hypothetical protein
MNIATTYLMLRQAIGKLRYQRVKYIVEYLLKAKNYGARETAVAKQ